MSGKYIIPLVLAITGSSALFNHYVRIPEDDYQSFVSFLFVFAHFILMLVALIASMRYSK